MSTAITSQSPSYLLTGKLALVTGSARGMGRTIALELASRGASVVINYSRPASAVAAQELVAQIKSTYGPNVGALTIQADVSDAEQIKRLLRQGFEHFSRPYDIVVSNSGVESFQPGGSITPDEIDRVLAVNTRGQLLVASEASNWMDPQKGGRIIMQSSVSAQAKGVRSHALYSGSKAAVEAFARCLAVGASFVIFLFAMHVSRELTIESDFGAKNITVNAIAPGGIKTDMYVEAARKYVPNEAQFTDEEIDRKLAAMSPLDRVGWPQDVARVVAFLCSEDGGWVNGQVINVSGGAMI